jgi:lysophospholipase L1-like esterase
LEQLDFPRIFSGIIARAAVAAGVVLGAAACGADPPTTPSPPPVQPLALTCPSPVTALSASTLGTSVSYAAAVPAGGQLPVAVTCTPLSGQLFVPGTTTVTCTATDAASATARCTFPVTVTVPPRLTVTRFLAFGDSITAGEVTAPAATALGAFDQAYRQIVVPASSYPTVLDGLLDARYLVQSPTVINAGKPGEVTIDGLTRFGTLLRSERPDVLLLLDGHNDLGSTAQAIEGYNALASMVQQAKASGVRVYLATLVPSIPGRLRSQPQALLLQFNDAVRTLAAREGVALVDLYTAMLPEVNTLIGIDGLHPNEAGYVRIANLFFAAIRADLEVR